MPTVSSLHARQHGVILGFCRHCFVHSTNTPSNLFIFTHPSLTASCRAPVSAAPTSPASSQDPLLTLIYRGSHVTPPPSPPNPLPHPLPLPPPHPQPPPQIPYLLLQEPFASPLVTHLANARTRTVASTPACRRRIQSCWTTPLTRLFASHRCDRVLIYGR